MNRILIVLFLLVGSLVPLASATNDVSSAYQTNSTTTIISDIWTEYQNVSIATGNGNTTVTISASIAINYSTAQAFGRLKRDGIILEKIALTQSYVPTIISFVAPTTETTGTHIYTFEAYCAGGKKCTFYNRTFSVIYLNTGSFGTGNGGSGNISTIIGAPAGVLDVSGTDTVTITLSPQATEFKNTTAVTANNTANTANATANYWVSNYTAFQQLQNNDTTDRAFVNTTFLPISTYSGNFPNTSLSNYLLISLYGTNFPNTTAVTANLTANNANATANSALQTATYNGDFPNSTISSKTTLATVNASSLLGSLAQITGLQAILNAMNSSSASNNTASQGRDDGINATVAGKTTLSQVNSSAQITVAQVTGLQGQQDAQNSSYRDSTLSIVISNATALVGMQINGTASIPASVNGNIINLSVKSRYTGAINVSVLYNSTGYPTFPTDSIGWVNVTTGNWKAYTTISQAVVGDGSLGVWIDASAGNVNVTTIGITFRRT